VVDKKRIIRKNGGPRRRRGTRGCWPGQKTWNSDRMYGYNKIFAQKIDQNRSESIRIDQNRSESIRIDQKIDQKIDDKIEQKLKDPAQWRYLRPVRKSVLHM
jgi:hypothetical protein